MPSVVAFYYQLATWFTFLSSFPCSLLSYVWICHVEKLLATSQLKHAAHLCGHKKLNKLDDRKNFESEKYANKLEIKKVWKQVKDGAQ